MPRGIALVLCLTLCNSPTDITAYIVVEGLSAYIDPGYLFIRGGSEFGMPRYRSWPVPHRAVDAAKGYTAPEFDCCEVIAKFSQCI